MSLHEWMRKYVNNDLYYEQMTELNNKVTCLSYSDVVYENGVKDGINQGKSERNKEIITNMKKKMVTLIKKLLK